MEIKETIKKFLAKLDIDPEEQSIFLLLSEYGAQPVSTIATRLHLERTRAYRLVRSLAEKWLITASQRSWVKVYFVSDLESIDRLVDKRANDLRFLEANKGEINRMIQSISRSDLTLPSIHIYEGDQMENCFGDMLLTIRTKSLKKIRFFGTNTFEEQESTSAIHQKYRQFLEELVTKKITLDSFIGSGTLIMERIEKCYTAENITSLPLSQSSMHMFILGTITYIIIYRDKPIGIRFDSTHFAHVMNLLFDNVKISGER